MSDRKNVFIAKTMKGLEPLLKKELVDLGCDRVRVLSRAVEFYGNKEDLYKANYYSRFAISILSPIMSFEAKDEEDFYNQINDYPWFRVFKVNQTFAISKSVRSAAFTHGHYMSLKMKDAIVDRFNEEYDKRPSIDRDEPDIKLHLKINENKCSILLDTSGDSLFKRGYRDYTNEAPLNEILAASLVEFSGWDGSTGLLDPTCGTGTIAVEAGMKALNIPAGHYRKRFGFEGMKDFNPTLWNSIKKEGESNIIDKRLSILGTDIEGKFIRLAQKNINNTPHLKRMIRFKLEDATEIKKPIGCKTIIFNPPYGERLLDKESTALLYKNIASNLRDNFKGCDVWVLSSNEEALKEFDFEIKEEIELLNGDLDCKYRRYSI